jgi:hypothetical protein
MNIIYPEADDLDILLCDFVVVDSKDKKYRKKSLFCKKDKDYGVRSVLRSLKIKTAKSIEIIPIKKIGRRNDNT